MSTTETQNNRDNAPQDPSLPQPKQRGKSFKLAANMRNTAAAIAATFAAGASGYVALTEIPRTTLQERHYNWQDDTGGFHKQHEWFEKSGTRYLFGGLKDGREANWKGFLQEGHFLPPKREDDSYSSPLLDGHGKRLDPTGKETYDNRELSRDAKARLEEGEFKDGKLHGHGKRERMDGTVIEGEFAYGMPNGHAVVTFKDGSKVEGEFQNAKPTSGRNPLRDPIVIETRLGKSISILYKFPSFAPLQGLVKGKKTDVKGEIIFDGELNEDQQIVHGFGKVELEGIGIFKGQIKDSKPHGKGSLTLDDGQVFDGIFNHGVLIGNNLVLDLVKVYFYQGEIKSGKPHGQGNRVGWGRTSATGTFEDGILRQGKFVDSSGATYEGEFNESEVLLTGHVTYNPGRLPSYDTNKFFVENDVKFGLPNGPGKIKAGFTIVDGWFENGKFSKRKPGEEIEIGGPAEYVMTSNGHRIFRITQDARAAVFFDLSGSCFWIPKSTVPTADMIKIDPKNLPDEIQGEPNCGRTIPHPNLFDD